MGVLWSDTAVIKADECVCCGVCVPTCPAEAILECATCDPHTYLVSQDICHDFSKGSCNWVCIDICPVEAIHKHS